MGLGPFRAPGARRPLGVRPREGVLHQPLAPGTCARPGTPGTGGTPLWPKMGQNPRFPQNWGKQRKNPEKRGFPGIPAKTPKTGLQGPDARG